VIWKCMHPQQANRRFLLSQQTITHTHTWTTLSTKDILQCIKKMFLYALSKSMCEVRALKTMSSYRHLTCFSAVTILSTVTAQNMYLCRQLRHTTCKPVLLLILFKLTTIYLKLCTNQKYIYIYIPIMYKIIWIICKPILFVM